MSGLQANNKDIILIVVSDLHFSHKPPVARSVETDWYGVQLRYINQLKDIQKKYPIADIICTGDIFDRWNPPVELVNFLIDNLPWMYAIPGQHDLPYHRLEDIQKSAYSTLMKSSTIYNLEWGMPLHIPNLKVVLHPFPWGTKIHPFGLENLSDDLHVAIIHSYIWKGSNKYPDAPEEKNISAYLPKLNGYDAAFFGDNHRGFTNNKVMNVGTFMRRKLDEKEYHPQVGLLRRDGKILSQELTISVDKFIWNEISKQMETEDIHAEDFLNDLREIQPSTFDFKQAVKEYMDKHNLSPYVTDIILKAMGENDGS